MSSTIQCPNCKEVFELKGSEYADILNQIRTREFKDEVEHQVSEKLSAALTDADLTRERREAEFQRMLADKEAELYAAKSKIDSADTDMRLAVSEAIRLKEQEVSDLKSKLDLSKAHLALELTQLESLHKDALSTMNSELERYKNFRMSRGSFATGDDLEKHCEREFNAIRAVAYPNATFIKDTKAVKDDEDAKGTKGDYIFREAKDGVEFISIMFEMKNELIADGQKNGTSNASHLAKLDKDRKKKDCEYAILVSTLEPDDELYNKGIVDVSHLYPKMFVVRPEFFLPILALLRNAALSTVDVRLELERAKDQNYDFSRFTEKLEGIRNASTNNLKFAANQYEQAVKQIDSSILAMQKIKKALGLWLGHLQNFDNNISKLQLPGLTSGNQTMKDVFKVIEQGATSPEDIEEN